MGSTQMRLRPLYPERDTGERPFGKKEEFGSHAVVECYHTSCGRTSGRECCTPQPAAAAPCPGSSRRWTPPGGCGWATGWCMSRNGSLHSLQLQHVAGKGEAPQSREILMVLGSKGKTQQLGWWWWGLGYVPGEKLRNRWTQ